MKVLHINYNDNSGGAAIAAYRHHEAMKRNGIDSQMLVVNKYRSDIDIVSYPINKIRKFIYRVVNHALQRYYKFYATWSWNIIGCDLSEVKEVKEADIIILHWINQNFLSLKSLENILRTRKPIYWFLHDMWPITGGCHHAFNCVAFQSYCRKCPLINNKKGSNRIKDIAYRQFQYKKNVFDRYTNLTFITPSKWLFENVKRSRLGKNHNILLSRNILDTELFSPKDKFESRKKLSLPLNKKLILFGADNIGSPYKGWSFLKEALNGLSDNYTCVIYGIANESEINGIRIPIINLGKINDIEKLIELYSACDVFVSPSLADNYPNVLIEAMACGLVCVGFNTGGIPEIIKSGENGYIVNEYDGCKLRCAILQVLNSNEYGRLSQQAIKSVRENNSYSNLIPLTQI